jgi:hypothetical protein
MAACGLIVLIGAFLLFQIQPIIGKYLLPWFGGGPAIWTVCLFFFQTILLAGYAYAHLLTRWFRPRGQVLLHAVLLICALACLPVAPSDAWKPGTSDRPALALLLLLTCQLGLPCLILASTGPLIQHWVAVTGRSPYGLYAWSNFASLTALLTYPVLFEPHLTRKMQSAFWGWGLVCYAVGYGFCAAWYLGRASMPSQKPNGAGAPREQRVETPKPVWMKRLGWILWPACSTVLLMAITNKLCLDVAVFPLLWVLPLAAYLLSFVICFAGPRWYPRTLLTWGFGLGGLALLWGLHRGAGWPLWQQLCLYNAVLFVSCMVCHGELFRLRPAPEYLTQFYLAVAAGGALGGLLVSLIAPLVFNNYYELHAGMIFCGFLLVTGRSMEIGRALANPAVPSNSNITEASTTTFRSRWERKDWRGLALAALWIGFFALTCGMFLQARRPGTALVYKVRNFYGVLSLFENRPDEPRAHHLLLQHGRITHGFQFADPKLQRLPTTYYGPESGLGIAFSALPEHGRRVGVVGLGTGTIAAYSQPGDFFQFYEINPQVSCLATSRFSFMTGSAAHWTISPGDARLTLERQPPQNFDLLALDAFNSDSIPVHLLTKEAFEVYLTHLNARGILAIHISNHFLNLEPVVRGLAHHFGLHARLIDHDAKPEQWWLYSSTWMLLVRDPAVLQGSDLPAPRTPRDSRPSNPPLWTDDFSSVFGILR